MVKKLIVVSAVNLVEAGTLAILRECLSFLSKLASEGEYRVIAIVFKKEIVDFPNIEYIETQWPKKSWINRLWYEYYSMNKISKQLSPVFLWFSLHDTSPTVQAHRRAVYCHNSYFAYKWSLHDLLFAPKIALFSIFTKSIYKTNIRKNDFLVVQQEWFRKSMNRFFKFPQSKIIVARPESTTINNIQNECTHLKSSTYNFLFAGSPNSHKNFEIICKATAILEERLGLGKIKIFLTIKGDENPYSAWLLKKWGYLESIQFKGFVSRNELFELYHQTDCLIFPSKVESWGLPISEFAQFEKPMLLADLPYAHETAEGSKLTAFFNPNHEKELADQMLRLINGDTMFLQEIPRSKISQPFVNNWEEMFNILLN